MGLKSRVAMSYSDRPAENEVFAVIAIYWLLLGCGDPGGDRFGVGTARIKDRASRFFLETPVSLKGRVAQF